MLALHTPSTIFSFRHAPSWMLLTLSAGAINTGAFLACQRFVTHVTGTATQVGMDIGQWWLLLDYALILLCFVAGAALAGFVIDGRYHRGKQPLYALPLLLAAGVVAATGLLGHAGAFGPFGGSVEQPGDFALLSLLSFAMGLQNASVATSTGMAVRTTHLTGPATDLGLHLATLATAQGDPRRAALRGAALRGGKIVAFIAGSALMVPLVKGHGYLAFVVPASLIVSATALSLIPAWSGLAPAQPQPSPAR